jgi:hypothetical protein
MKYLLCLFFFISSVTATQAQQSLKSKQYVDLTLSVGSGQTNIASGYFKDWNIGKKQKFYIGTGFRVSGAFGKNQTFKSAPAKLASNNANIDSLLSTSTRTYAMNLLLNFGYHLSSKVDIGFNIDLIGISFGSSGNLIFKSNNNLTSTTGKPTGMNLLLVGNNDRGTLNSEFYCRYQLNNKWGVKLAMQHFFTELTTPSKLQVLPEQNDRFRNITNLFSIGIARHF